MKLQALGQKDGPRIFLRLFAAAARIPVRMNTSTACLSSPQAGLFFGSNAFAQTVSFSTLMRDEGKGIARGLHKRDPDLLDRLIEQYQYRLFRYLRSEEHTSELQSHVNLVCRLLLE